MCVYILHIDMYVRISTMNEANSVIHGHYIFSLIKPFKHIVLKEYNVCQNKSMYYAY